MMDETPAPLTQWQWTDADFAQMGWHDATVHAFAASPETFEFLLDLDYIVRWNEPDAAEGYYTFWVAPATLVFHDASVVEVHVNSSQGNMTILDLERGNENPTPNGRMIDWLWSSFGVGGYFSLRATGYTQYIRRVPIYTAAQSLSLEQRGGISFSRGPLKAS